MERRGSGLSEVGRALPGSRKVGHARMPQAGWKRTYGWKHGRHLAGYRSFMVGTGHAIQVREPVCSARSPMSGRGALGAH